MLALFGRAAARDFVDVAALRRKFPAERLLDLAAEKDPGFDRRYFAGALRSVSRLDNGAGRPASVAAGGTARRSRSVCSSRAVGMEGPPSPVVADDRTASVVVRRDGVLREEASLDKWRP